LPPAAGLVRGVQRHETRLTSVRRQLAVG